MMFSIFHASRIRFSLSTLFAPLATGLGLFNLCAVAGAQTLSAPYSSKYSVGFNGVISGVTANNDGLLFKQNDPNTLLILGGANSGGGTLYSAPPIPE